MSWETVKAIDKSALERQLGPMQLDGVELLLIDEFAIQRGHRYATVIVDAPTKRVLWVGRADLRPFFELLGPAGCRRLKAIGMDMNGACELEGPGALPAGRDRLRPVPRGGQVPP